MRDAARAYVALGTNLPHEALTGPALLAQAVSALQAAGLRAVAASSVWETPAWPTGSEQPNYFNAVVEFEGGNRDPENLYAALCGVEQAFGRARRERWAARTLDLDIVAMDGFEGTYGDLILPHPRMHERAFVLAPLVEIAPDWRHPRLKRSAVALLGALTASGYRNLGPLRIR